MKVACPSCQALFEADEAALAGPGLLLCETCSAVGGAPPPPPPPVEGRRKRPRMPEIHFGPPRRTAEPPTVATVTAVVEPTSDAGAPVPAGPAVLDGGFGRSEEPVSVFPPAPLTMRGAELSLGDYASDVEPVSLHDLEVVLAPPRLPPAWSGSAIGSPTQAAVPEPAPVDAKARDDDRSKLLRAARKKKKGSKPSFFQVDSIPPPPISEDVGLEGLGAGEAPKPSSRPSDIRDLIRRRTSDRPKRGLDLAGLTGALFEEQPPHASQSPAPVVAERRAPKPGAGARGVLVFVGAGIAVGVVAFQLGLRTAAAPSSAAIDAAPTATPVPPTPPRAVVTASPAPAPRSTAAAATTASARRPDRAPIAEAPRAPRDTAPPVSRPPQPAPTAAPDPPSSPAVAQFDSAIAGAALRKAAATAASCHQGDDPTGSARVSITFAPSGRVTSARVVGPPFQGTRTGGCIALSFGSAAVLPFTGDPVTVSTDVNVR
jgi:hypothetical protein